MNKGLKNIATKAGEFVKNNSIANSISKATKNNKFGEAAGKFIQKVANSGANGIKDIAAKVAKTSGRQKLLAAVTVGTLALIMGAREYYSKQDGAEKQKADGSLRCKNCGYTFIVDLTGIEDINLELKKEKYNNKEYYAITTKEWESIYKKCPICKENCILHQKKDCENFYNCYFNEIQCKSGKDHIFMLIK